MKRMVNFKTMLAVIGLLVIGVASSISVLECTSLKVPDESGKELALFNLNDLITKREVQGNEGDTEVSIIDKVLKENENVKLTRADIAIKSGSFKNASYTSSGSAIVIAKADKFIGEVTIEIKSWLKVNLNDLITNKKIAGSYNDNENQIIDKVLAANPNANLSKEDIQIKLGSLQIATSTKSGLAIIVAKTDKFIGEVEIIIEAWKKVKLTELIKHRRIAGSENDTEAIIINKVLKLNENSGITNEDLAVKQWENPTKESDGLAIIGPKSEENWFEGTVFIWITKLPLTKEEALENLKNVSRKNLDNKQNWKKWEQGWESYFEALKIEINTKVFEFTDEDLKNETKIKTIIVQSIKQIVLADLNNWQIPREYDSEKIEINYWWFSQDNQYIKMLGEITIPLTFNDGKKDQNYLLKIRFDFELEYKVIK